MQCQFIFTSLQFINPFKTRKVLFRFWNIKDFFEFSKIIKTLWPLKFLVPEAQKVEAEAGRAPGLHPTPNGSTSPRRDRHKSTSKLR